MKTLHKYTFEHDNLAWVTITIVAYSEEGAISKLSQITGGFNYYKITKTE